MAGLVESRREPVMRSDALGSAETSRLINTGAVGERHHRIEPWSPHQTSAHWMARTSPPSGPDRDQPPGRESRGRTPAVLDLPAIAAVIIPVVAARSAVRVQLAKLHNMLLDAVPTPGGWHWRMARQVAAELCCRRAIQELRQLDARMSEREAAVREVEFRANKRRSQAVLRLCPLATAHRSFTSGKLDIAASAVHRGSIRRSDHA
jgi:hypothetical protein